MFEADKFTPSKDGFSFFKTVLESIIKEVNEVSTGGQSVIVPDTQAAETATPIAAILSSDRSDVTQGSEPVTAPAEIAGAPQGETGLATNSQPPGLPLASPPDAPFITQGGRENDNEGSTIELAPAPKTERSADGGVKVAVGSTESTDSTGEPDEPIVGVDTVGSSSNMTIADVDGSMTPITSTDSAAATSSVAPEPAAEVKEYLTKKHR